MATPTADASCAIRTSASQTTQSSAAHSNASNGSHILTLSELNDLALRGPEAGQINYYFLHQVIDTIIKELGMQEHPSAVLESYVSVDDAYLVPQTNSAMFDQSSAAGSRRRSNGNTGTDHHRSSGHDLHASRSQLSDRPKQQQLPQTATTADKSSTIAIAAAKSAPSVVADGGPSSAAPATNDKNGAKSAAAEADGKNAGKKPSAQDAQRAAPSPSPAFTDASSTGSTARKMSPKEKVGVIVRTPQPQSGGASASSKNAETPLQRALSKSNLPVGNNTENLSGAAVSPISLGVRDSGTSTTNTTTIKVYNAVPPGSNRHSATGEKNRSLSATDSGHVRARLERLEKFMNQLFARGGAVSAEDLKSMMAQIDALAGETGKSTTGATPSSTLDKEALDKLLQRVTDAEKHMANLHSHVKNLVNSAKKFDNFLGNAAASSATDPVPSAGDIHRKATLAHIEAQDAASKLSKVESKIDNGFAHAQAERAALAAKADNVADELRKAKAEPSVTLDDIDQRIRNHLAGIVSWGELDDALQEMRDSFARLSLGGGTTEVPAHVAATAAHALASSKAAAAADKEKQQKPGTSADPSSFKARTQIPVTADKNNAPASSSSTTPRTKRYTKIKGDDDKDKNTMSAAERAAKREEVNSRAAAWSATKAARSPGPGDSSSDVEGSSPQSLSPPLTSGGSPALARSKENVFRQLEQLSRTGKTLPTLLDELQERIDKAATQEQVNAIIDEIASDLTLQNQRIEALENQMKSLEERMLEKFKQQQSTSAKATEGPLELPKRLVNDNSAANLRKAQRDKEKAALENELSRASAELLKKRSEANVDDNQKGGAAISDEWLKLQEARIQNILDRIDSLRSECEGDRTELVSSLNIMGAQLKECQKNYAKLAKQLQDQQHHGGDGTKYGCGRGKRGGNNAQNPFAEDDLDDLVNECQNDIETLKAVVKELALKDGQLDKAIEAIMELIERLQETKADKTIINTLLSTKADKKALETKISRSSFEMLETKWQSQMESLGDKIESLDKDMRIQKNRHVQDHAAFATRDEVRPLHDAVNGDLRILKEQMEKLFAF